MRSFYVKKRLSTILLLFFVVLSSGLALFLKSKQQQVEKITISVAQQPALALIFIAQDQGFFSEEGIEVTLLPHLLGRDALQEVIKGNAELATVYDIPFLKSVYEGEDLAIVSTLHSSVSNHAIATLKQENIQIPQDLKHKRIGVTKGISTEYFLYIFLRAEGINPGEVTMIDTPPEQLISSLESNQIDAAVLFNPYANIFERTYAADQRQMFFSPSYTEMSLLVGYKNVIASNPSRISKVLKALLKAEQFLQTNTESAIVSVDKSLGNYDQAGVRETWNDFSYKVALNNVLLTNLKRESFFIQTEYFPESQGIDHRKLLHPDILHAIKPEAVTVN